MSRSHPHYPVFLDLVGRRVVIVGAGEVSERKVASLARCGATVTVVAPEATTLIEQMADAGLIALHRKRYDTGDLEDAFVVIAATNDAGVNRMIAEDCRSQKILVNVIDDIEACDFIVPAVVDRGSIQIAISTGGKSPALARQLRKDLEQFVGPEFEEVNDLFGELRETAKTSLPADEDRKRFFEGLLAQGIVRMIRERRRAEACEVVAASCKAAGIMMDETLKSRLRGKG